MSGNRRAAGIEEVAVTVGRQSFEKGVGSVGEFEIHFRWIEWNQ